MKGYLQIYTGNGKGKTTASIGLAVRASGAGLSVLFAQFVKGEKYSEIKALEKFAEKITVCQYGLKSFIVDTPSKEDIEVAQKGLRDIRDALEQNKYQLVILDEANIALYYNLFSVDELIDVINKRSSDCEIVITGRNAPQKLIDIADLVTEMREIKHYYSKGVNARIGIEM